MYSVWRLGGVWEGSRYFLTCWKFCRSPKLDRPLKGLSNQAPHRDEWGARSEWNNTWTIPTFFPFLSESLIPGGSGQEMRTFESVTYHTNYITYHPVLFVQNVPVVTDPEQSEKWLFGYKNRRIIITLRIFWSQWKKAYAYNFTKETEIGSMFLDSGRLYHSSLRMYSMGCMVCKYSYVIRAVRLIRVNPREPTDYPCSYGILPWDDCLTVTSILLL